MPGARCTRSLAWCENNTRVSHHRFTGSPGTPCAMVLTASFVLSLVTGLSCHHHRVDTSAQFDAGVGASGPHDFAPSAASSLVRTALPCDDAAASTASQTLRS
jgi:hypothetical protein